MIGENTITTDINASAFINEIADALWTEVTSHKNEKKSYRDIVKSKENLPESKRSSDDEPRTKQITSLDLANSWVDSEHDKFLYDCKSKLLSMSLKSLKNNNYNDVHETYNFVEYLSPKSQGFFRRIVYHEDVKGGKVGVLYDWNSGIINEDGVRSHVYIACVDNLDENYCLSRFDIYDSIYNNNLDEESNLTKKGYSILRRYSQQDFVSSFMKLHFFANYELAKAFIIHNVNGRVTFISKKEEETS